MCGRGRSGVMLVVRERGEEGEEGGGSSVLLSFYSFLIV